MTKTGWESPACLDLYIARSAAAIRASAERCCWGDQAMPVLALMQIGTPATT